MESHIEHALPKELREILIHDSHAIEGSANGYRFRETKKLLVDTKISDWESVKGGYLPNNGEQKHPTKNVSYEVLFNRENAQWLKIAPAENGIIRPEQTQHARLRNSVSIARTALEIADLPHLADEVRECLVTSKDGTHYGFLSPHIGPSIEFITNTLRADYHKAPEDFSPFFTKVYDAAFHQAATLFLDHGQWQADPNKGNILLHKAEEEVAYHVVLIDFSNDKQRVNLHYKSIPQDTSDEMYQTRVKQFYDKRFSELQQMYYRELQLLHVPTPPNIFDTTRYKDRIQGIIASHTLQEDKV